ncbi:MAG: TonB-dependent receptor domain-containing protein, partial [Blastocatellia bacterium]
GGWKGNQLIRFGGSYYYWQDNRNVGSFQNGQYTFEGGIPAALNNFVLGTVSTFSTAINPLGAAPGGTIALPVTPANFNRSISAHDFSLYFNDSWRISPRVNVVLGLRYDFFDTPRSRNDQIFLNYFLGPGSDSFSQVANGQLAAPGAVLPPGSQTANQFFKRDWNNFAPRLGIAWDITGNGRTSLRAGYGITYERLFYAVSPFFQTTSDFAIVSLTAGTPGVGPIPLSTSNFGPLSGTTGTAVLPPTLVRGIESDIQTPRVHFWTVSLEHEIFPNTVAAVQYAGAAGRDLFTLSNVNRPGSAAAFLGSPDLTARLNPTFGPIFFLTTSGKSNFNAFIVDVSNSSWRRLGLGFSARYRFAKALDNVSGIFGNNIG